MKALPNRRQPRSLRPAGVGVAHSLLACLLSFAMVSILHAASAQAASREGCRLDPRPGAFEIHAVSTWGRQLKSLAQFGEETVIVEDVEVAVSKTQQPIVLVLSASEETVWTVNLAPGAMLAGIIIFGNERRGIVGIDDKVPVVEHNARTWRWHCPPLSKYIAKGEPARRRANDLVKEITGRDITAYHLQHETSRIVIGPPAANWTGNTSSRKQLGFTPYRPTNLLLGRDGLQPLVTSGNLRRATRRDIGSWAASLAEVKGNKRSALWLRPLDEIYVVSGLITLPDGLIGSQAVTFLLSDGAPAPAGPRGDNLFYSMTDFTCHPQCGREKKRAQRK
ncbi:MAG: hypothetical protein MJE12_00550 [Alphaproteobacteria bacterium]|nr:hypothetical protein [Alphaproteobacteria bacterium]